MNSEAKCIGIFLSLLMLSITSFGQASHATMQTAPYIAMGSTTISLGESANYVVASLSHEYTVTVVDSKTSKTEEWLVSEMGSKLKIPIATLYAQAGKVTGFDLTSEISDEASAHNTFNYFFSLVDQLTKESRNRCTLTSETSYFNGSVPINKASVDFVCGPYNFYILQNEFHNKDGQVVKGYLMVEKIGETD